jgi:hypothetical protein
MALDVLNSAPPLEVARGSNERVQAVLGVRVVVRVGGEIPARGNHRTAHDGAETVAEGHVRLVVPVEEDAGLAGYGKCVEHENLPRRIR